MVDGKLLVNTGCSVNLGLVHSSEEIIDISMGGKVKKWIKLFGPGWDLVKAYKNGQISEETYRKTYLIRMRHSYQDNRPEWEKFLKKKRVRLFCFCKTGFCHRFILAEILIKLGAEKGEWL